MIRRNLVTISLSLVLCVVFAGTGFAATALTFATHGTDQMMAGMARIIAAFERENAGVNVEVVRAVDGNDLTEKAIAMFAAGIGPDIIGGGDSTTYSLMAAHLLMEITPLVERDPEVGKIRASYLPGIWEMSMYGDNRYILPSGVVTMGMYLNHDQFGESGVALPDKDWTWDEFLTSAKKLTTPEGSGTVRYGFGFDPWEMAVMVPWVHQAGGTMFDNWFSPSQPRFTSGPVLEALRFVHGLRWDSHVIPRVGEIPGKSITSGNFSGGHVSMFMHFPARVPQFARNASFEWDIYLLPSYRQSANLGAVDGLKIGSQTKHVKEAWEFIKFMAKPYAQEVMAPLGQIPSHRGVALSSVYLDDPIPGLNKRAFLESAAVAVNRAQDPALGTELNRIFMEEWARSFANNSIPIEQAAKTMNERMSAFLGQVSTTFSPEG